MKKLKELIDCNYNVSISGISTDSRKIKPGYLFIAIRGFNVDHFEFIDDAIKNGAVAIVTDRIINVNLPVVVVDDLNSTLSDICKKFYEINDGDFSFIGITGTDGKTTVASICKQLLNPSFKTAYIGTNGFEFDNNLCVTENTTPCIEDLYKFFSTIKDDCKTISMEVSSEAMLHHRVDIIKYDIVGFTNITEDHLNIHKTLDNYINCKKRLITLLNDNGYLIVNGDDDNCKELTYHNMYTYGFNSDNNYVISNVKYMRKNVSFDITNNSLTYHLNSPLLGKYNIYNVTLAFIIGIVKEIDSQILIDRVNNLLPIKGRGEYLDFSGGYDIVLDYAHTYNGIKNLIESIKDYDNIYVVTGAAGGREKEKRKLIGKFLLENVTKVIFTMDDPRFEDPNNIINDMLQDTSKTNYEIIIDRAKAINYTLSIAKENDIVLIIGKGRDNYMAICDRKIKYCDYDVIKKHFE